MISSLWLPYLSGSLEISLAFIFLGKLLEKQQKIFILLPIMLPICWLFSQSMLVSLKVLLLVTVLFLCGTFLLKTDKTASLFYAMLITEIMQLCFGLVDSLLALAFTYTYHGHLSFISQWFPLIGDSLALITTAFCCLTLYRLLKKSTNKPTVTTLPLIILLTMMLSISDYICHTFYSNTIIIAESSGILCQNHVQLLSMQLLMLFGVFALLPLQQIVTQYTAIKTDNLTLRQQNYLQKYYVRQAQTRYQMTRSFRHDLKNHLVIIKGLLERNELTNARNYLAEMTTTINNLSFPYSTNYPLLDALLDDKLSLAKSEGIAMEISFNVPISCGVNDTDLCLILNHALTQSFYACEKLTDNQKKFIHLSAYLQGELLLIEIKNSFISDSFKEDVSLTTIQQTIEKYNGLMSTANDEYSSCLTILLNISQQSCCR